MMDMEVDQARKLAAVDPAIPRASRTETERTRHRLTDAAHLVATFDRGEAIEFEKASGPIDLAIQATNSDGELAPWLDDIWWTEAITRLGNECVTIRIAPTPDALLHPVLLYQLHMLRRVVPSWRIVGHAYGDDVCTDDQIKQLAASAYHEVRFVEQVRTRSGHNDVDPLRPLSELFGAIRIEQRRLGLTLPVLSRLSS